MRYVTRTIKHTIVTATVYNKKTKSIEELSIVLMKEPKDYQKAEKIVTKMLDADYNLLEVESIITEDVKYKMSVEKFVENADVE